MHDLFYVCYVSSLCKTTAELQTFSNHPKVTATRKKRPPESNGPFGLLNPKITGAVIIGILRYVFY